MKKRILGLTLIVCVLLSVFSNVPIMFAAEAGEYTDGNGFTYKYESVSKFVFDGKQYSAGLIITDVLRDDRKDDTMKDIVFPEEINGVKVTQIESRAIYYYVDNIKDVYLSKNIEYITSNGGYSEENGHFLESKTLNNIFVDDDNAFYKSIDGVLYSKDGAVLCAFPAGKTLESYDIPSNVTCIGAHAFQSCESIKKINIPGSVTKISNRAFSGCKNLAEISLPMGLQRIGEHAFSYTNLKNVVIPDSVSDIGLHSFYSCDSLEEVRLPNNLKTLGKKNRGVGIFHGCGKLERLIVPNNVEGMYSYNNQNAYDDCSSLKVFSIPKSVKECTVEAIPEGLQYLYYGGSEDDWNALFLEQRKNSKVDKRYNEILKDCKIFYNTDLWKYIYGDAIKIIVNSVLIAPAEAPMIENGRTLVPLRAIFEALDMSVEWDGATSTVKATGINSIISMKINDAVAIVNGKNLTMDVPPRIVDGRTFVPVRFIAESIGAKVDWDGENRVVDIKYIYPHSVEAAQAIYDNIESLGGQKYLNMGVDLYKECYDGAVEAYNISNDINQVYNTVGYLTTAAISIGSLCVGNVVGVGQIVGGVTSGITLDVASDMIEKICDTEEGFVCFMLANADTDSYKKFADYHASVNRDIMTIEQSIEYLTKYYEAQINNKTVLMAFRYFASKCPENFGQALLNSAKAAFGPIISGLTGDIFDVYKTSTLALDMANFFYGTSLNLLDMLGKCDNEIIAEWANEVETLNASFSKALYGSE